MRLPRVLLGVATLAATIGLTGCEAQTPSITVFSGRASASAQALCWSTDSTTAFTGDDCAIGKAGDTSPESLASLTDLVPTIVVVPGFTIGVSVPTSVGDVGWSITLNGKPLSDQLHTSTFERISLPASAFRNGPIEMRVYSATDDGKLTRGMWVYALSPPGADGT